MCSCVAPIHDTPPAFADSGHAAAVLSLPIQDKGVLLYLSSFPSAPIPSTPELASSEGSCRDNLARAAPLRPTPA